LDYRKQNGHTQKSLGAKEKASGVDELKNTRSDPRV